ILVDLPDRAEVIRQMRDAGDHPGQLHLADITRRAERLRPTLRGVAQPAANLLPFVRVDASRLPRLVPFGIGDGIAAFGRPSIHHAQRRSTVPRVIEWNVPGTAAVPS